mmetsp:Transcript_66143/g.187655  ORF Transcript_66143/g.187655 Transcript_66143/m.187655 type:complete len:402 (-) Transcript_66143:8-1213(-)
MWQVEDGLPGDDAPRARAGAPGLQVEPGGRPRGAGLLLAAAAAAAGERGPRRGHHAGHGDLPPRPRAALREVPQVHAGGGAPVLGGAALRHGAGLHRPPHAPAVRPPRQEGRHAPFRSRPPAGPEHQAGRRRHHDAVRVDLLHPRGQPQQPGVAEKHLEPGAGEAAARHRDRPGRAREMQRHAAAVQGGQPARRAFSGAHGVPGFRHQAPGGPGGCPDLRPVSHGGGLEASDAGVRLLVGRLGVPGGLDDHGPDRWAGLPAPGRHGRGFARVPGAAAAPRPRDGDEVPAEALQLPRLHRWDPAAGPRGEDELQRVGAGVRRAEPRLPRGHRDAQPEGTECAGEAAGHDLALGARGGHQRAVYPLREGHGGPGVLPPLRGGVRPWGRRRRGRRGGRAGGPGP